ANEILDLLAEIHRSGTTIVLVTHDVKVAAKTERVLFLFDGQIAGEYLTDRYDGTVASLREREEKLTAWLAELNF
ncbi:MAG: hypothetical protein KDE59_10590, partial [Anaerolineales bacterium]|nr:hypothetical protein [Anaerolineales bacterium]